MRNCNERRALNRNQLAEMGNPMTDTEFFAVEISSFF